jgi:hypothetical protein
VDDHGAAIGIEQVSDFEAAGREIGTILAAYQGMIKHKDFSPRHDRLSLTTL